MKVELLEELLLDASANALAEQRSIRYNDGSTRRATRGCRLAFELAHDELEEQQRSFRRLAVFREVTLDAFFLLPAERWVGEDHIDSLFLANLGELEAEGVVRV